MPRSEPRRTSHSARLAILSEVARLASDDLALGPMLQRITDALAERLGWELVALVRIDADPPRFVCEALTTSQPTQVHVGYGRELGSGVVGRVAATGQPIVIEDAAEFPGWVDTFPGARSELCVPVLHRGRTVALLNAESRRRAAFRGQLPLAQEIAAQIGGAIANARLYEDTRRRTALLEVLNEVTRTAFEVDELAAVLDRIAGYVQSRFDLVLMAIVVSDGTRSEWRYRAFAPRGMAEDDPTQPWPVSEGVVGRAILTGEPQLVLDVAADADFITVVPGVRAEYVVPLRLGDEGLGAFDFEAGSAAVFSDENLTLFRLLTDQVAGVVQLALVNRRLRETQEEIERANARLHDANRALERLSRQDGLTGVANRRHFDEALGMEWRRSLRSGEPLALLLADLDHFKAFNDAHGHLEGDDCLRDVAQLLAAGAKRAADVVARYGGEEFALLLPATDEAAAVALAESLCRRLEACAFVAGEGRTITLSAGVAALVPTADGRPEDLVAAADRALYRAKQDGRNRVCRADGGGVPGRPTPVRARRGPG